MSVHHLVSIFPKPEDLLSLAPEDLGGVVVEIVPSICSANGLFIVENLQAPLYHPVDNPPYPRATKAAVGLAFAEAVSWLITQGLVVKDPGQQSQWYRLTRRAGALPTRADVESFRKGRILPDDLLPPSFSMKVVPIFRRGDYDVAVFQAFKAVEVAVKTASNAKGADYSDSDFGVSLMRKAFHPEAGPLTDKLVGIAEREATMHLFSGAIGHARNPLGHKNVFISAREGARLIIFASYLLDIIEKSAA
jgi:Protein of unknown function (Hypoth_ymh)